MGKLLHVRTRIIQFWACNHGGLSFPPFSFAISIFPPDSDLLDRNQERLFRLTFHGEGGNVWGYREMTMNKRSPKLRFVVHEHHASHLHYDFRLEVEGVLKSWAIPKGPSMNPDEKRLAIMVEDHAIEYGTFEGIIPEGNYGAGAVVIWDEGSFFPVGDENPAKQLQKGRFSFELRGKKLKGTFSMVLLKGRGKGNQWLFMKKRDDQADPGFKLEVALTNERREKLEVKIPPCETDSGPH